MLGHDKLPASWIEEDVPNQPGKLRWWRSAEHQATRKKPLRSWPEVMKALVDEAAVDAILAPAKFGAR